MHYFFIPGNSFDLSLGELKSLFALYKADASFEFLGYSAIFVHTNATADKIADIFQRCGGFTKYGELVADTESFLTPYITANKPLTFGVSAHFSYSSPRNVQKNLNALAKEIKEAVKETGVRVRYIKAKGTSLNSAQIIRNELITKGFELSLFFERDKIVKVGRTLAVQDIDQFSERDFGKPASDKQMGMIPPKLARMMVNLAQREPGKIIWDPFCGSGNILLEAIALGYNVLGSDISDLALEQSRQNIEWISQKEISKDREFSLFKLDVLNPDRKILSKLKKTEISSVIFEPYMGPPQLKVVYQDQAERLVRQSETLFRGATALIESCCRNGTVLVGVFPSYKTKRGWLSSKISGLLSKKWEIINPAGKGRDLHWSRSNSIIRRNILVARLQK